MKQKQAITKHEEETKELAADFGQVYVKIHDGQLMEPVKANMTLNENKGHTYSMRNKHYITGSGYKILNKVASINLVTPKAVIVDGKEEPNPYVERNENTRAIEAVASRKIGIGFSPLGNITVIDKTLYYNVYTYLIQSIQAKMKREDFKTKKKLHPDCAKIGIKEDKPKTGKWVFFETAAPLGIWANYEDQAIIDCLEEHTQRQRFGDRIAQSICERNILRDHPAIGVSQVEVDDNGIAKVTVYGWRHQYGPRQVSEILDQAEAGAEEIEVKKETIEAEAEEEKQAIEEEAAAAAADEARATRQESGLFNEENK